MFLLEICLGLTIFLVVYLITGGKFLIPNLLKPLTNYFAKYFKDIDDNSSHKKTCVINKTNVSEVVRLNTFKTSSMQELPTANDNSKNLNDLVGDHDYTVSSVNDIFKYLDNHIADHECTVSSVSDIFKYLDDHIAERDCTISSDNDIFKYLDDRIGDNDFTISSFSDISKYLDDRIKDADSTFSSVHNKYGGDLESSVLSANNISKYLDHSVDVHECNTGMKGKRIE